MEYQGKEIVVLMHTKQTDPVRAAYDLNDQVSALQQAVIVLREAVCYIHDIRDPFMASRRVQEVLAATNEVFQTKKEQTK